MFGYGKRIKELEDCMRKLKQAERCRNSRHEWEYQEAFRSRISEMGTSYDTKEGKRCKHCYKFVEFKESE